MGAGRSLSRQRARVPAQSGRWRVSAMVCSQLVLGVLKAVSLTRTFPPRRLIGCSAGSALLA